MGYKIITNIIIVQISKKNQSKTVLSQEFKLFLNSLFVLVLITISNKTHYNTFHSSKILKLINIS